MDVQFDSFQYYAFENVLPWQYEIFGIREMISLLLQERSTAVMP